MCCKMAWHPNIYHTVWSICLFFQWLLSWLLHKISREKGYLVPTWVRKVTLSTFRMLQSSSGQRLEHSVKMLAKLLSELKLITFLSIYLFIVYRSQRVTYELDKKIWVDGRPSLNPVVLNYLKRSESKLCCSSTNKNDYILLMFLRVSACEAFSPIKKCTES